jgi:hypothetical protein
MSSRVAALMLVVLWSRDAGANDGISPRTPVLWEAPPCKQRVDRSVDAVLHLPYAIPHEDTNVLDHEVENSRTHQFFAVCRPKDPRLRLPPWITWADVDMARQANLILPDDTVDPEEVLESSAWTGCWTRITEDADRRPITYAMADEGVDWDTAAVEPGAHTVYGYTYHPRFNLWSLRPGVVKVHDGDPDAAGPAAAITTQETVMTAGDAVTIEGCLDTPVGSTLSVDHADASTPGDPSWTRFVKDQPVEGEEFSVELVAPETLAGTTSMIRVEVRDGVGRTYTAYMEGFVIVLEHAPASCGETDASECESTSTGDDAADETSIGSTGDATPPTSGPDAPIPKQDDDRGGCTCRAAPEPSVAYLLWLLLLFRMQRRSSHIGAVAPTCLPRWRFPRSWTHHCHSRTIVFGVRLARFRALVGAYWAGVAGLAVVTMGCGASAAFSCEDPNDCMDRSRSGFCEASGFCSFPDDECPSGRRYGKHAAAGLAGACVPVDGDTEGTLDSTTSDVAEDTGISSSTSGGLEDTTGADATTSPSATVGPTTLDPTTGDTTDGDTTSGDSTTWNTPVQLELSATIAECTDPVQLDPPACAASDSPSISVDAVDSAFANQPTSGWLQFEVPEALSTLRVTSVRLQLVVTDHGSADGDAAGEVWSVQPFDLETLTEVQPTSIERLAESFGPVTQGDVVEWHLPASAVATSSVHLGVIAVSTDGVNYWNNDGPIPPVLLIDAE